MKKVSLKANNRDKRESQETIQKKAGKEGKKEQRINGTNRVRWLI